MTQARTLALATILASTFALSGCAGATDPAISAELTETTLDLTVEDDALGHIVEIDGIVRNFTYPGQVNADSMEIVLVDVAATAGNIYHTPWIASTSFLRDTSGEVHQALMASQILAAMEEDGYTPFDVETVQPGEAGSGWIPYGVTSPRTGVLDFVIDHPASRVMGGVTVEAEKIPAAEYSVRVAG